MQMMMRTEETARPQASVARGSQPEAGSDAEADPSDSSRFLKKERTKFLFMSIFAHFGKGEET